MPAWVALSCTATGPTADTRSPGSLALVAASSLSEWVPQAAGYGPDRDKADATGEVCGALSASIGYVIWTDR